MHLNSHLAAQGKRFQEKMNQLSPGKRQYHVHYTIIEKTITTALPTRTIHSLKPKNASSQTSFKRPLVDYEFMPTLSSRQSISSKRPTTASIESFSKGLKSRCQSAFSRTQALKQASQERKAERVLSSIGLLHERGRRGE